MSKPFCFLYQLYTKLVGIKIVYKEESLLAFNSHLIVKPNKILFHNIMVYLSSLIISLKRS
jgi:hypothetical protein